MAVVPFRWLSRARGQSIQTELARRLEEWSTGWLGNERLTALVPTGPSDRPPAIGGRWFFATAGEGRMSIWLPEETPARVGAWLAGAAASGDDALATGVGVRALNDAMRTLAAQPTTPLVPVGKPLSERCLGSRSGGILLRWEIGDVKAWVYLDAAACDAVVPPVRRAGPALVPLMDAIGHSDITLSVVLDLGGLPLADVSALRPGDLLRSRIPVVDPLKLVAADGTVIARGPLAARDGHRAMRIK